MAGHTAVWHPGNGDGCTLESRRYTYRFLSLTQPFYTLEMRACLYSSVLEVHARLREIDTTARYDALIGPTIPSTPELQVSCHDDCCAKQRTVMDSQKYLHQ